MKLAILALGACLAVSMPSATSAQTPNDKVTLYSDDFAGSKAELGPGKYDYMTLVRGGMMAVKSVKVPQGMRVTLYERDNFEGGSVTLTDNTKKSQLEAKGFGSLSMNVSVVVEKIPAGEMPAAGGFVTIYRDDFSGTSKNLVAGRYDFHDLGEVDNDQLSSVKIPNGFKVTLYEHGGFKGRSLSLTSDTRAAMLVSNKFNDITSSIWVEQAIVNPAPAPATTGVAPAAVTAPAVVTRPQKGRPPVEPVLIAEPAEPIIYAGDFSGASKSLAPGRYSSDELGVGNNELSSIKVPNGFKVTLYDGDAWEGQALVVTGDARASVLAGKNFNNLTSSVLVEKLTTGAAPVAVAAAVDDTRPAVTLFRDDFSGVSKKLAAGKYTGAQLGIGNDMLSSIQIPRGYQVTLYEHEGFGGRVMTLRNDANMNFFTANSFNDLTSSLVIEQWSNEPPLVTVYTDNFDGGEQTFAPGRYALSDFTYGDDQISSIRVPKGMRAVLYEDDGFKGYSLTAERDIDLTISGTFDNRTSSLVVEDIFVPTVTPVTAPVVVAPLTVIPAAPGGGGVAPAVAPAGTGLAPAAAPCEVMTSAQFDNATRAIQSKNWQDEMMTTAQLATKGRCLTIDQIRSITKLFMDDDKKLEFAKYSYDLCQEKRDFYLLEDAFSFMSTREKFTQFLKSK